ncbi:beta-ketoacyl-[acyl-carrier-protein] synthase family protein [Nonomuraea angiospora]|uniref:beta-ketoacyl-[acyl-carrier-protein] synthase family protein n=1 Tax=Nonomuraea angiospora TaxID=46172 RepID=UPI003798BE4A
MIASMWDMRSSGAPARARVAVTGMGVRTPAGAHSKELWAALLAGRSTARTITSFDAEGLPVDFACQVPDLDLDGYVKPRDARRMDRVTRMAFCAATDALADAGRTAAAPERRAVVTGTGYGGVATQALAFGTLDERGRAWPGPLHIPMSMHNAAAAELSIRHAFLGPSMSVATACASGSHAIGEGMRLVRDGTADVVLAGGMEAAVQAGALVGFGRVGALSRRASEPERASRPFDADRDGFVLGEGAAFLVLERLEDALRRGAHVYAELSGYGRTSDGHHLTAPDPEGGGAYRCMRDALADAGIAAADVVHVNAHATSTRLNDEIEARAIARLFGEYAVPVTGSKSVIGHGLGASGAIEAVISVLTLSERAVHPTANLDRRDPACPVDVVTAPRPIVPGPVLSNSFAFGGHNATLVFTPLLADR